jgi:hypothetical protein
MQLIDSLVTTILILFTEIHIIYIITIYNSLIVLGISFMQVTLVQRRNSLVSLNLEEPIE